MRNCFKYVFFAALAACSDGSGDTTLQLPVGEVSTSTAQAVPTTNMRAWFSCLDREDRTVVAAHRGGPDRGYPENALPTFENMVANGITVLEVDVATSRDGVLFLHHDDYLGRTMTGDGAVAETDWRVLKDQSLKDSNRQVTAYGPTTLEEALEWSEGKAILELDIKRSTDYDDIERVVKATNAEDRVILIAYSQGQAMALHRRLPRAMLSVPIQNEEDLQDLLDAGMVREQLLAWTGVETPDADLSRWLESEGIESLFGTLGRDGLDNQIKRSGDETAYVDVAEADIELIATDRPIQAARALAAAGRLADGSACPVK